MSLSPAFLLDTSLILITVITAGDSSSNPASLVFVYINAKRGTVFSMHKHEEPIVP